MLDTSLLTSELPTHLHVSPNDLATVCEGMIPAFRDLLDDETHISTTETGEFAKYHDLSNLPLHWIDQWDEDGYAISLKPTVVAGYMRGSEFYTVLSLTHIKLDA